MVAFAENACYHCGGWCFTAVEQVGMRLKRTIRECANCGRDQQNKPHAPSVEDASREERWHKRVPTFRGMKM